MNLRTFGKFVIALFTIALVSRLGPLASGAELIVLDEETWASCLPQGKEVDAIYGDFVLRNDRLIAVIARPVAGRNANMTVRNVGGCIIDLTLTSGPNDQLSAYYPGGNRAAWRKAKAVPPWPSSTQEQESGPMHGRLSAKKIVVELEGERPNEAKMTLRYTLEDGSDSILVETEYRNPAGQAVEFPLLDDLRADGSFNKSENGKQAWFWAYDPWWGQAYGLVVDEHPLVTVSDGRNSVLKYVESETSLLKLEPGQTHRVVRRIFPAATQLGAQDIARRILPNPPQTQRYKVIAVDTAGHKLNDADVTILNKDKPFGTGKTSGDGSLTFEAPAGEYSATVVATGTDTKTVPITSETTIAELQEPGYVRGIVTDETGGPIPCKISFEPRGNVPAPHFFHDTGEIAVRNVVYSSNGRFLQPIFPGTYECIISHGPEHDAAFVEITVESGKETLLEGKLIRSVQTPGYVSSDFHSHSTPSGDNTSSQFGRVLNLLCEHIEFAPCTEHNRFSTYVPHLRRIGAESLMATCTGIELTNNPGDVNHQNAFPFILHERIQDNGAPVNDEDPEKQIERLALWDNKSEKLVQQNHPDIGHLFFDKNGDGKPDGGFKNSLGFIDVIEVHPISSIFSGPTIPSGGAKYNNTVFNWLQLLNQGVRNPGVTNTDAHYNFHGSGFLRIYLQSPTDDPAQVQTMDMVHAAEQGRVVMTSGPYLEANLLYKDGNAEKSASIGDEISLPKGEAVLHVRVQCPNWFDVDRVQILLNGRMPSELNFTRGANSDKFAGGVVKFDQMIPLTLKSDTHVIVVAAGENSKMGAVMGPDHGNDMPVAVSNPIFVDVDGGGFKANGDTLDAPLPVKGG